MNMIETTILQALQTAAIAAIAELSAPYNALAIKAIGRVGPNATAAPDGSYFEFVNIPNNRNGDYYGNERVYQGNFRIILHWKVDDSGSYVPMGLLDQVAAYFPKAKGLWQAGVRIDIYDIPSASGPIEGNAELLFPVTLPYRCFTA